MPKTTLKEKPKTTTKAITTSMKGMSLQERKDVSKEITESMKGMDLKESEDVSKEITKRLEGMNLKQKKYKKVSNAAFLEKFNQRLKRHKKSRSSRQATKMYGEDDTKRDDTTMEEEKRERQGQELFNEWWMKNNSDEEMDLDFGKKQKKDIKGMIKKILLYGGLPTLLVVSLGVLSNKKFSKKNLKQNTKVKVSEKLKKNTKVKVSKKEKLFKKDFVKKLKEMILERKKELDALEKDARNNEIESQNRQTRRKKRITNPFEETPEYKEYKKIAGFGRTRNK